MTNSNGMKMDRLDPKAKQKLDKLKERERLRGRLIKGTGTATNRAARRRNARKARRAAKVQP